MSLKGYVSWLRTSDVDKSFPGGAYKRLQGSMMVTLYTAGDICWETLLDGLPMPGLQLQLHASMRG